MPILSVIAPKASVTRKPDNHDKDTAAAEPLLLTLVVNISPTRTFGITLKPKRKHILNYNKLKKG